MRARLKIADKSCSGSSEEARLDHARVGRPDDDVILRCSELWKVFGGERNGSAARVLGSGLSPEEKRIQLNAHHHFCALSDVSLDVYRGEILMVMGLSGSGKSTLLRCMSRLVEPTSGKIILDGSELLSVGSAALMEIRRRKIGMVFQNFGLLPHLTAIDNVVFPLRVQGVDPAVRYSRGRELLELVGLADRAHYFPPQLSGGQQQRVGIARSLVGDPSLWFLDEPFSALDPLIRRQMQDEFLRLQSHLGKSIVFVTHDFAEATRLGDRIAIMRDGEIVQIGTSIEIMLRPADDYVRRFIADVPMMQTITLRHLAENDTERPTISDTVPALDGDLTLDHALPLFMEGAMVVAIHDRTGKKAGEVTRGRYLELLSAGKRQP